MTSRPDAAAAPLPMTVSSMVRPLAVVMVDMGISSWWKLKRSGKTGFRSRTGGAGVEAVLQRSGGLNVRERAGIGYKYLPIATTRARRGIPCRRPFGPARTFTQWKHSSSIILLVRGLLIIIVHGREAAMGQNGLEHGLEEFVAEFRTMLPAQCKTAQAIDRQEPFEEIAFKAIDEGYVEFVDQFSKFMEICLRRGT